MLGNFIIIIKSLWTDGFCECYAKSLLIEKNIEVNLYYMPLDNDNAIGDILYGDLYLNCAELITDNRLSETNLIIQSDLETNHFVPIKYLKR